MKDGLRRQGLRERAEMQKRARSFEIGSSKGRLDIKDKTRFKKRFSNKVPSKFSKECDERVFW